jgi:hypothetical protein
LKFFKTLNCEKNGGDMKARVHFEVTEQQNQKITEIAEEYGGITRKQLFLNAFSLLIVFLDAKKNNRKLAIVDDGNKIIREIILPFF